MKNYRKKDYILETYDEFLERKYGDKINESEYYDSDELKKEKRCRVLEQKESAKRNFSSQKFIR